ncbi:hypothetical protein [Methylocella sp.]|jgi:hypothetical protein|uniref:hypothetical protein n=1 Tax=Methylocella sp. TaxID=1978226 RepID=UPI003C1D86BE
MMRLCASSAWLLLFAVISGAQAVGAGVPKLDVEQSCREAQTFSGTDNKLAYKGCMQDENDALKQLQQNWSRFKPENRSTCLAQGLSPMPSYVEILTCIEMYDSAGMLNKGSAAGQMNEGVPPVTPTPGAPAASSPPAGGK